MTFTIGDVRRDSPIEVDALHDGEDTREYQLLLNGAVLDTQPKAALKDGRITFAIAGLPKGEHELIIRAVGEVGGDEASSDPFGLVVVARRPSPPHSVTVRSAR